MSRRKACKICKRIFEENACPICESEEYSTDFKGKVYILDPEKSEVAKKLNITHSGEYSVKT